MALLSEYQARLIPIIQKHGGSIDKFLGDGVIATFGVARSSPAYAADAIVALDEALAEIDRWNADRHTASSRGQCGTHDRVRDLWRLGR
jgi:adenylate cyclase